MGIEFAIKAQFLGNVAHKEHDAAGLAAGVGYGGEGGCRIKLAAVTPMHLLWAMCLVLGCLISLRFFPTSLPALWVVFSLYIILLACISGMRFKRGRWKKKRILEGLTE